MTTQQRGPNKMEDDAVDDFLRQPCRTCSMFQGRTRPTPRQPAWRRPRRRRNGTAFVSPSGTGPPLGRSRLWSPTSSRPMSRSAESSSHGWLAAHMIEADPALRYLSIDRAHGFSFENTTVSLDEPVLLRPAAVDRTM